MQSVRQELSDSSSYLEQQSHPRGEAPTADPLEVLCSEQDGLNRLTLVSLHSYSVESDLWSDMVSSARVGQCYKAEAKHHKAEVRHKSLPGGP